MVLRIREFITDVFFFAIVAAVIALVGYLLYLGWEGEHPAPVTHWNQGPQDPEPTH